MGKKSSQGQAVESADTTRAQNPLSDADGAQAARKQRSPAAHQGIQVNFCKNPICANQGQESTSYAPWISQRPSEIRGHSLLHRALDFQQIKRTARLLRAFLLAQ